MPKDFDFDTPENPAALEVLGFVPYNSGRKFGSTKLHTLFAMVVF